MTSRLLAAAFIAALTMPATARAADETAEGSVLYCAAPTSDFRVGFATTVTTVPKGYGTAEPFNASVLMKWSKDPAKAEDAMRTGSRVKHLHCGDVTIDVRAGFYNGNPQGELGAADDFARLTIIRGANKIDVSLLEDGCSDASIPRAQAAWGEHPVMGVEGHKNGRGYQIILHKAACSDTGEPLKQHGSEVRELQFVDWP